jgi:tetratricopeptide (TPR) repeat protein
MQTQNILDTSNIAIPERREDALQFFRERWELASKLPHEDCIQIAKSVTEKFPGDIEIQGDALILSMMSSFIRNKHQELMLLEDEALELFLSTQNKDGEGITYVIMGARCRSLGDNDSALNYIEKGLALISEGSSYFLILGYYQGAELFYLFNKLEESLKYFNKALSFPKIELFMKARLLNGIGNVFLKQRKFEEANKLLQEAYDLVKEKGNKLLNARLLSDIGNYYYETKDYGLALEYENQSYELRKELGLKDPCITNFLHFYKIYMATGEDEKAFQSLQEAYALAKEKELKGKLVEIYQNKVEYFENKNEFKEALAELKNYVSSREHEMNSSFDLKINGIKAVHEVEFTRKEAEITREKNKALSDANEKINLKNRELKLTLDELTRAKISRKAVMVTLVIGISLCLLTEIFVDPLVDDLSYNNYISLAVKVMIAISLKPIDTAYERYMIKKALE